MKAAILVVDDSALARAIILRHLAEEGYGLREADSGEAALAACADQVPDVILMDVEMPGLNGHETLRRMKADPLLQEVPVLFLTGRTDASDVAEGLRLGAHDYLRKPFEAIELVARVRAAVRMRELQEALRERNAALEHIASVDPLTGLFNRRFMEEQSARAVSRLRRHGGWMAAVLLDLDAFKAVNDTYGHETGDAVLVAIARRLGTQSRLEDLIGRWGGEEFLVVATQTDGPSAAGLAERLRRAIEAEPVVVDGHAHAVTISAGWAAAPDGVPLADLVRAADRALYDAKEAGRNAVRGAELPLV